MDLNPRRFAVIAVHLQNDIVTTGGAYGGFFAAQAASRDVIGVTGKLLDAARTAGATVLYLVVNSPLLGMVIQSQCLVEGSKMAEIVPELAPRDGDLVLTHQRVSGFSGSQLDVLLRARGVDTLAFAGVATNASVEGTARQASDLGYHTIIVADACSAADDGAHNASIASLGLLAEIATSSQIIEALARAAASR
jgi:nicotinamidase-related amidase